MDRLTEKRDSVNEVLDGLVERIEDSLKHSTQFGCGCDHAIRYISNKVTDIPSADVRPERHGVWVDIGDGYVACSECGEEHGWQDYRASYCDTCGAKMNWEDNDNG